ncbi:hypothetical protein, partial [Actinocatenispora thailandica]|uniref:hypothetical protein n=1 Tax=Actinocatenispora thailandica TaxID=227318 RepID=UPI0031DC71CD
MAVHLTIGWPLLAAAAGLAVIVILAVLLLSALRRARRGVAGTTSPGPSGPPDRADSRSPATADRPSLQQATGAVPPAP